MIPMNKKQSAAAPEQRFASRERTPSVDIRDVNHYYGAGENRKQVLFHNNLQLYPGEIVIMTGPSGSGKTTLLTLIGALRSVQEGNVTILDRELKGLGRSEQERIRTNIGFIFQAHNLFESLTAHETIRLVMQLHDYSRSQYVTRPAEILTELGLADRMHYKPENLSGGQRQRVAIGRALVNHPKLILADEPTAALDKDTGRKVVTMLQERAKNEACTILIVTHDNRILDVADRIVNMVDGYIVSNIDVAESLMICNFLKKCKVFAKTDPTLLADVAGKMTIETVVAGNDIITEGEVGDKFYLIRSGTAEAYRTVNSNVTTLKPYVTGDFFGELALLSNAPRGASVRATSETDLLVLDKAIFVDVVKQSKNFEDRLKDVFFHK